MPPEIRVGLISLAVVSVIGLLIFIFDDRPELAAAIRRRLAGPSDMSSTHADRPSKESVADHLPITATSLGQRSATTGNAVNTLLPGNVLPEEAREIIRYQAKVEALSALISAGKVPQTEGIELVFDCKRSGRADSPYGKARAAVQAQLGPARPEFVGDMIARVQSEVAEEAR